MSQRVQDPSSSGSGGSGDRAAFGIIGGTIAALGLVTAATVTTVALSSSPRDVLLGDGSSMSPTPSVTISPGAQVTMTSEPLGVPSHSPSVPPMTTAPETTPETPLEPSSSPMPETTEPSHVESESETTAEPTPAPPTQPSTNPVPETGTPGCGSYWSIAPGDTLSGIAKSLEINIDVLAHANDIIDYDIINAHDVLCIPGNNNESVGLPHTGSNLMPNTGGF